LWPLVKTFWSTFVCEKLIITTWQHCQRALMPFFPTRFCPELAVQLPYFFACFVGCPNIFYAVLLCFCFFVFSIRNGQSHTQGHTRILTHTHTLAGVSEKVQKSILGKGGEIGDCMGLLRCVTRICGLWIQTKQSDTDRNPHMCTYEYYTQTHNHRERHSHSHQCVHFNTH